jgi:hypothetical protein
MLQPDCQEVFTDYPWGLAAEFAWQARIVTILRSRFDDSQSEANLWS